MLNKMMRKNIFHMYLYYTHKVGHLFALVVVVVGIVESKSIIDQTFITSMFAAAVGVAVVDVIVFYNKDM